MSDIDFGTHPALPWPEVEALRSVLADQKHELQDHTAALRMLDRHEPVVNHGRFSDGSCVIPEHCDEHGADARPPVCKTCRDYVGDPVEYPCDVASDLGAMFGVDLLLSREP